MAGDDGKKELANGALGLEEVESVTGIKEKKTAHRRRRGMEKLRVQVE